MPFISSSEAKNAYFMSGEHLLYVPLVCAFFYQVSPTYIPEHSTINVKLHSFDYVLLEGFSKHVQKMASYFDLDAD